MALLAITGLELLVAERVRDVLRSQFSGVKDTAQDEASLDAAQPGYVLISEPLSTSVLIQPEDDDYLPQQYPALWVMVSEVLPDNKSIT